jgi:hypothetical protein
MTLLSHSSAQTENPFRQARHASGGRVAAVATDAHWTAIKRFCLFASMILLAGSFVAGIISPKTAAYLSHFNY